MIALLHFWFKVKDLFNAGILFMFKSSVVRLIIDVLVSLLSENFLRHFCKTSLADAIRTLLRRELASSKSKYSVDFSCLSLCVHAVGSTTKAIAFAWRISVNHLFLSSSENEHNKNVRAGILPDKDRLTILKQYLVCLSWNSSMYIDMSLKNITSLGASSNDSFSVR